ncbi:murein biosynthesis integral membrane protein MurJ [Kocuria palustris]|uniref:murein biosynthesis integral membrane protein MurJ n=1 Tax=Kocuria palustris TaxID=71999 RepID=UPI0011A932F5|nr:murein biosynthesis integral membrane protein MurJ [Kocuria palustris]
MARSGAMSSAIMASGTLVSRVLGFVKTILITVAIGSLTSVADIFQIANNLPNYIYVLVAGGVFNAVLVPQVIKASRASADDGADYISRLLTLAVIGLAGVTLVVVACTVPIIRVMTQDWSDQQLALGVTFALFTFPQIFFYGLYTVVGQVLNAKGAFGWYMWAPVVNNLVAIAGLLVFIQQFGSFAESEHSLESWTSTQTLLLAGVSTLGVALQALVLFWPLKRLGLGLRPKFGWRGIGLSQAAKLSMWTLATGVVANLAFLALTRTASIPTGYRDEYLAMDPPQHIAGSASLDQASMLYSLPHGVIGLSIATVLFNSMAAASAEGDDETLKLSLSKALRYSGIATVFCTMAMIVFAGPLGMLFSGGVAESGAVIGQVFAVIAIGAPFMTTAFMLGRLFYSREDARTPFFVQLVVSVLTVLAAVVISRTMPPHLVVFAVAACYAGQNIVSTLIYHVIAVRTVGDYRISEILDTHVRAIAAAMVTAVIATVLLYFLGGWDPEGWPWTSQLTAIGTLAVGGVVSAIVYLLMLRVVRLKELPELMGPVMARLRR